jgi:hypothetical protein
MRSQRQPDPLFFVLDVEQPAGVSREFCAVRHEHVAAVREAGLGPWVYSSASQWWAVMGSDETFASLPLWKASYIDGVRNWPEAPPALPMSAGFGGWREARGWQVRGTTALEGVAVDTSFFDATAFVRTEEEDGEMNYPLPHVDWRPPAGGHYRSYYLSGRAGVVEKHFVASAEHRKALVAAGVIEEPPITLPLEQLRAIPCAPGTPEPDAA